MLNSLAPTTPLLDKWAQGRPFPDLLLGTVRFLQMATKIDRTAFSSTARDLEHVAGLLLAACTLQMLGGAASAQHSSPVPKEAAIQGGLPPWASATAAMLRPAEQLQDTGALQHLASCITKAHQVVQQGGIKQSTSSAPGFAAVDALAAVAGVVEAALAAEAASARQGLQCPSALVPSLRLRTAVLQAAVAAADFAGRLHTEAGASAAASAPSKAQGAAGRCGAAAAASHDGLRHHVSRPAQQDLASETIRVAATACDMLSWMLSSEAPSLNEGAVTWELGAVQGLQQALKVLTTSNAPQSLVAVAVDGWVGACAALTAAVARDRPGGGSCRQELAAHKLEWAGMIAGVEGRLLQRPQCKQRRSQHVAAQQQALKEKLNALSAVLCIEGLEQDSRASVQLSGGCIAPDDRNCTTPDGVKGGPSPSALPKVYTNPIYPMHLWMDNMSS